MLAGNLGIEQAAKAAGFDIAVPFYAPGRGDATAAQTDAASFDVLEPPWPMAIATLRSRRLCRSSPEALRTRPADGLTAPEMTVLIGGMRVIGAITAAHAEFYRPRRRRADE